LLSLQELRSEVPAEQQVLSALQSQDPRDAADDESQTRPRHAGYCVQAGAGPLREYDQLYKKITVMFSYQFLFFI